MTIRVLLLGFLIILVHQEVHVRAFANSLQLLDSFRQGHLTAPNIPLYPKTSLASIPLFPIQSSLHLRSRKNAFKPTFTQLKASTVGAHLNLHEDDDDDDSASATRQLSKSTKMTIFTILIATTLNLLGFTLTSPLNPTLGRHFNLPTGASFGSLTSAYPAGMLLGQFTWPRLSDYMGRKKILAISLLGSGLGLSLQALAVYRECSLGLFLATRVFTGIFSGSAPVAKAFLADIGDQHSNTDLQKDDASSKSKVGNSLVSKYLGWRDASSTFSYMVGPALGGILYETVRCWNQRTVQLDAIMSGVNQGQSLGGAAISESIAGRNGLACVIGVSALASLIASFMVMTFVTDTSASRKLKSTSTRKKTEESIPSSPSQEELEEATKKDLEIISCPLGKSLWSGVATVCLISFLYHIADSTFFAFYPALLQNQMGFDAKSIGLSFTGFAAVSFIFSASSISSKLIARIGVVNTCATGLAAIGVGLLGLSASASSLVGLSFMKLLVFGAASLYFASIPMYGPTIPTMLVLCVPPHQRGTVMGVDGIVNTMGRIVSPLIMGDIYRRCGASTTFGIASAAVFTSSAIALVRRFFVRRGQLKMAVTGASN